MSTEDNEVRRSGITRRAFLRAAAVAGGAALLAACGGNAAQPAPQGGEATEAPGGEAAPAATTAPAQASGTGDVVEIEWVNPYTTPSTQEAIPLMIGAFEEANPGIKVNYQNPGMGDGYTEQLLARIAGGNPPDMATLFSTPAEFAARGSLLELDQYMQSADTAKPDAFYPAPLASCQWQGKTYGLPSSAGAGAIYLNVAKFQEKGISTDRAAFPKTWDEARALAKEFTVVENGEIVEAGYTPFVGGSWLYPAWAAMNGGKLYDQASNTYMLDSDENVAWLDYWLRWLDEDYGGDLERLVALGNWDGTYPDSQFQLGKLAMANDGSWAASDADIPFEWEVVRFPVGPGGSQSYTAFWPNWWAIPKGSKHPDEAFKLVEWVATRGWEIWYRYILDTPAWKEIPQTVVTAKLVENTSQERAENINAFFADYLNDAVPMWNSPIEAFAQETLGAAVADVLAKAKTPKDALAEANKLCQDKLNETLKA
jgi:multiple sugar transport system substrate-binding protein